MDLLMRRLAWLGLFALVIASQTDSAIASTIGPKDDWIPIEDATKPCPPNAAVDEPNLACGLSQEQVDTIMAAGVGFTCPGMKFNGKQGALNGWFLGDAETDTQYIYTNMHGIVDQDGIVFEPLEKCFMFSYLDPKDQSKIDVKNVLVGAERGYLSSDWRQYPYDKAKLPLRGEVRNARSLEVDLSKASTLKVGHRLFFVAFNPDKATETRIQVCSVIDLSDEHLMQTDCDNESGTSGGLFFSGPDSHDGSPASLRPIAIHASGYEKFGDNAEAEVDFNSTGDILLDDAFFEFVPFERN